MSDGRPTIANELGKKCRRVHTFWQHERSQCRHNIQTNTTHTHQDTRTSRSCQKLYKIHTHNCVSMKHGVHDAQTHTHSSRLANANDPNEFYMRETNHDGGCGCSLGADTITTTTQNAHTGGRKQTPSNRNDERKLGARRKTRQGKTLGIASHMRNKHTHTHTSKLVMYVRTHTNTRR